VRCKWSKAVQRLEAEVQTHLLWSVLVTNSWKADEQPSRQTHAQILLPYLGALSSEVCLIYNIKNKSLLDFPLLFITRKHQSIRWAGWLTCANKSRPLKKEDRYMVDDYFRWLK